MFELIQYQNAQQDNYRYEFRRIQEERVLLNDDLRGEIRSIVYPITKVFTYV